MKSNSECKGAQPQHMTTAGDTKPENSSSLGQASQLSHHTGATRSQILFPAQPRAPGADSAQQPPGRHEAPRVTWMTLQMSPLLFRRMHCST